MNDWSLPTAARRHPSSAFGLAGGLFALALVAAPASLRGLAAGGGLGSPSAVDALLVAGGFLGGALLARLLWTRLDGVRSPRRGAAVGALIGLLALPVPVYLLELGSVVAGGVPADLLPGTGSPRRAATYLLLLLVTPFLLGALAAVITRGGTVLVGAAVGYLLARR